GAQAAAVVRDLGGVRGGVVAVRVVLADVPPGSVPLLAGAGGCVPGLHGSDVHGDEHLRGQAAVAEAEAGDDGAVVPAGGGVRGGAAGVRAGGVAAARGDLPVRVDDGVRAARAVDDDLEPREQGHAGADDGDGGVDPGADDGAGDDERRVAVHDEPVHH